jgi:hypothetical protein
VGNDVIWGGVVSPDEARRWLEAFTVLSIERFAPVFSDMGLPTAIVTAPNAVVGCTRALLEEVPDDHQGEVATLIERALSCIADEYDSETARAVSEWCRIFVVDEKRSAALFAWEQLLRRLCGLVTDDALTVPSPLKGGASDSLCQCISSRLQGDDASERDRWIEVSDQASKSSWEERLNDRVRRAAGDVGRTLGAIEMAQTTVSLIVRRRRVYEAASCLKSELSVEELRPVLAWARVQGERLGIPMSLIEPGAPSAETRPN